MAFRKDDVTMYCRWFDPHPDRMDRCARCQQPGMSHDGIDEDGMTIPWERYVGTRPCGCERRKQGGRLHLCAYHAGWNDALDCIDRALDEITENIIGGAAAADWLRPALDDLAVR